MKKKIVKRIILTFILTVAILSAAHFAMAAQLDTGIGYAAGTGLGVQDPRVIAANIIRIVLGFLGIIAVGLIIYAGWLWMTAAGEEEKVEKAKKILLNAVIGLVIILASFAIASFVLSRLIGATTGGDNGPGGGGGGTGGSGYAFSIAATRPADQATGVVRNVVIKTFFNKALGSQVDQTVLDANFKVEKIADIDPATKAETALASSQLIVGSAEIADGRMVINFKDTDNCGDAKGTLNCLPAWSKFKVTVNGYSGIVSAANQSLSCSAGSACQFVFSTSSLVDANPPVSGIVPAQMCQDDGSLKADANTVMGWGRDDIGISALRFTQKKDGQIEQQAYLVPGSGQTYQAYSYKYDTAGLAAGDKYSFKVYAYDQANHAASSSFTTVIKPGHCCNGIKDGNETEVDCGGDCLACFGGACNKIEPNQCGSGQTNCDDNLCSTFFCDCQTDACLCGTKPMIFNVSPYGGFCANDKNKFCVTSANCAAGVVCDTDTPNGSAGNFVSITGKYFGATPGKVLFNNNQPAALANSVNVKCGGSWTDSQIIAVVPAGAADGPVKVQDKNNNFDITSDSRGPYIKDFLVNNIKRPGVCLANPDNGFLNDAFNLQGNAFNGANQAVLFGNETDYVSANNVANWSNTAVDAAVPNITAGLNTVYVNVSSVSSNKLLFDVKNDSARNPVIDYIEPTAGPIGQYITIYGSNFKAYDAQKSSVKFYLPADPSTLINADIDFPVACQTGWWHDSYIVVKVPKVNNLGLYKVIVNNSDGRASAPADFTVNNDTPAPGLCSLDPNNGPAGQPVSAYGERFGSSQGSGKIQYYNNKDGSTRSWADQKVDSNVPAGALTGPVKIINGRGGVSNSLPFRVGKCSTSSECNLGEECCGAGTGWTGICRVQGSCSQGIANSCEFSWSFKTSQKQAGDPCYSGGIAGTCDTTKSQCGNNLVCDATSCVCKKPCSADSQKCSPDSNKCSYSDTPVCNQATCLCECAKNSDCLDGETCNPATHTCTGGPAIESCAGYGNQCSDSYFCPNSPGKCSAYSGGRPANTVETGSCDISCNSIAACAAGKCTYDSALNRCSAKNNSVCQYQKTVIGVSGNNLIATCAKYENVNRWVITTAASCPDGYDNVGGGKCVDKINVCQACDTGFYCLNGKDANGICVINQNICPAGSICGSDNKCTKIVSDSAGCECCCRKDQANADCCISLTCAGACGAETDPNNTKFGVCTGCTVKDASGNINQAASNAKCNCSGSSGKFCNTAGANGLGTCQDCASLSAGKECNDQGAGTCCVDAQKNTCRGGAGLTGSNIIYSGPAYSYCAYYTCASSGNACAGKPVASSTAAVYTTPELCAKKCSGTTLPGQECVKEDGATQQQICDNSICSNLTCLNADGTGSSAGACGTCCCDPKRNDQCAASLTCVANKGSCSGAGRGLCCGCTSDNDCGSADTVGCGTDSCCQSRPVVQEARPSGANVCRNSLIQATFNMPMQLNSFSGNVIVAADYGADQCPPGLKPLTAVYRSNLAEKIKSWLSKLPLLDKLFANPVRAENVSGNFCAIMGIVGGTVNGDNTTTLEFAPAQMLGANRTYYVIIKGDTNLTDAVREGVLSQAGISLKPTDFKTFNGVSYSGRIWSFTTKSSSAADSGVCRLDTIRVDPYSYLFTTVVNDAADDTDLAQDQIIKDSDKIFSVAAYSADSQRIVPIADVYDWRWDWAIDDQAVVKFKNNSATDNNSDQTLVAQQVQDANTFVHAKATITVDTVSKPSSTGTSAEGLAQAYVMLCANPWPAYTTDSSGNTVWETWRDNPGNCNVAGGNCANTNFELYYCRDAGGPGTADDLPAISATGVIRPNSPEQNILKEFYFFRENQ